MNDGLGKEAEKKIWDWLDRPEEGGSFDRFYDQLSGYYLTSRNICDFVYYKYPYIYYIESKATWKDNFPFTMISEHQYNGLLDKSKIQGCYGIVIVLFATQQRAFVIDINAIKHLEDNGHHSLNIKKIDKWGIPYFEIATIPNSRKKLLDYTGEIHVRRMSDVQIH